MGCYEYQIVRALTEENVAVVDRLMLSEEHHAHN